MKLVPLQKVFTVMHGNKFDLNKMSKSDLRPDAIAFIGRTGERNGFVAFVDKYENIEPFESGLITVALGGSALASFVQPRPFYTAQNIDVLRPLSAMSLEAKLYYCLCIEANRFRYSTFGREANRTLKGLLVPPVNALPNWIEGASTAAVEELRQNLFDLVSSPKSSEPVTVSEVVSASHGPKPDVLTIEGDWQDAIKISLQKKKPVDGWPK